MECLEASIYILTILLIVINIYIKLKKTAIEISLKKINIYKYIVIFDVFMYNYYALFYLTKFVTRLWCYLILNDFDAKLWSKLFECDHVRHLEFV